MGNFKNILIAVIVLIGIGYLANKAYDDYRFGEKKPFWKDTELIQVCKTPYYSSDECNNFNVTLLNNNTAIIHFPEGGDKYTFKLVCYFSTDKFQKHYVFCRSWDSKNQQWDFAPLGSSF